MTVQTNTNVASFNGNGVTQIFPIAFKFNNDTDLVVLLVDDATGSASLLTLNSDYTVSGEGDEEGGLINVVVAPASGQRLKVTRVVDILQLTDLRNQGKFFAEVHEDAFDLLTMIAQQHESGIRSSLRVAESDPEPARIPAVAQRANKILSFDADGNPQVVAPVADSSTELRMELASADGVKLVGGALRKVADVDALRAEQGTRDGEQVWLEAYGTGFANGGGGGPLFWDAASVATDDGWRVFAVSGVTTGRWVRPVTGEIDVAWFGLPKSGFCYDEIVKIEAYCFANKVGCYFGPGVYDVGAQNWPFRNPEVPATSLRDYAGVVIRTAGPATIFKTTSDTGADVLQCNGIKGLRVVGYPTVTATLNATTGSGSNGLSITYGGQDLYFELNCVDLPFVDKGTYGDGGKAFSIQPGSSNTNPIRNIVIKGLARNCLYATGVDVTYDSLSTNPITGVVFDVVAEDCFRAFSGGVSAPTVTPVDPAMLGVSGRIKAINCQQVIVASRTPGMSLDIEVLNTKAKAELGGYLASFPVVQVADVKAIKNSSFILHGRVRDIDTLLSTGGTSMGGGISGDCAAMQLVLDVSFSSATTQVEVISSGGNRVSSSDISLYGVTVGFDDLLLYGGNSLKVDGKAKSPTAYPGDASVASAPTPFFAAIYAADLTAVRTVSLNASAKSGDRVRVSRLAASTGSTLSVGGLRNITAGQWIECTYNGSAWEITSSGSI